MGTLLFLIYVNNLPKGITSICNLLTEDTSPLSKTEIKDLPAVQMNEHLKFINNRDYQWKMLINLDPNKQATEICFHKSIRK